LKTVWRALFGPVSFELSTIVFFCARGAPMNRFASHASRTPLFLKFGIGLFLVGAPIAACATLRPLYQQLSWSRDVDAVPLRSDARIVGRAGSLRLVSIPGHPPRHVGCEANVSELIPPWVPLEDRFARVCPGRPTAALLSYTQARNSDLELLSRAPDLHVVELDGTLVTDEGIGRMRSLKRLFRLSLAHTGITNSSLEMLSGLSSLKALDLRGTRVTGDGLKFISRLPALETLDLSETQVTGVRLVELLPLSRLESLSLDELTVDDDDLEIFIAMPTLQNLSLAGTRVTDAGLLKLTALPALRSVWVADTRVTDAGILRLENTRGASVRR